MGGIMSKHFLAAAAVAAIGFAGAAYAGDAAPKAMSDSEMDKVTAGFPTEVGVDTGLGIDTAHDNPGNADPSFPKPNSNRPDRIQAGHGVCAAGTNPSGHC
jgi:hypothetical protein